MVTKAHAGRPHGDTRHAPGLLVAGNASHHELERHTGLLRGCRHAAVDVSRPMDGKASTTQNSRLLQRSMNWFYRNLARPAGYRSLSDAVAAVLGRVGSARLPVLAGVRVRRLPTQSSVPTSSTSRTSAMSEAARRRARPCCRPPGARLMTFYNALAPAITARHPSWLLFFQDRPVATTPPTPPHARRRR